MRIEFKEYLDAESEVQLMALLPDQQVMLAFDLVFAPKVHAFTVVPTFDHWVGILEQLKALEGYDVIISGHDRADRLLRVRRDDRIPAPGERDPRPREGRSGVRGGARAAVSGKAERF